MHKNTIPPTVRGSNNLNSLNTQAFTINNKKVDLLRANIAFKGVFLPSGTNVVLFKFGSFSKDILNMILLLIFYCTFIHLLFVFYRKNRYLYE